MNKDEILTKLALQIGKQGVKNNIDDLSWLNLEQALDKSGILTAIKLLEEDNEDYHNVLKEAKKEIRRLKREMYTRNIEILELKGKLVI